MYRHCFALPAIVLTLNLFSAQAETPKPAPAPLVGEERSPEWLIAIEKLRSMPRPGDIQNTNVLANITDVIETTPEQKATVLAVMKAYDAAMVQKAAQWETDMKAARAEYEAKVIAALPEAKRDVAKKVLDLSHEQWVTPLEYEAKIRSDFLKKKEKAEAKGTTPEELDAYRKDFMSWLQTQRQKLRERNMTVSKSIKALLDPKEVERLNDFDRNKEMPVQAPGLKKK